MPGTESVRVVVRVRPLNPNETQRGCASVIDVDRSQNQVSIFNNRGTQPKTFAFDAVYDPLAEQQLIYDETGFPLVENVLEGYNGTIFAYGQTGCGKTFTMSGTPEKPGVIPNSFKHIFGAISDTDSSKFFLVYCSFIEIYNEEIRDLLNYDPKSRLELKENVDKGVYVKGVTKESVNTIHDINKFMEAGASHRTTKETMMNERSSRSHSIFTVYVEMSETVEERTLVKAGKLNLVDLAGSERQKKTQATGDRLKEAIEINLSLSALGNVISALVDGQSTHIPYRDSKLTRLLQDSLGGNTKTIMIAVASPADYNYDESLSTLRYASRAKFIQNKPKINEDPKDTLLREYLEEINRLKKMLAEREGGQPMIVEKLVERIVEKQVEVKVPYYIENPSSAQGNALGKKQSTKQLNSEGSDGPRQQKDASQTGSRTRSIDSKPGSEGRMLKDRLKPRARVLEDDEEDSDEEAPQSRVSRANQEKRLVQKGLDEDSEEEVPPGLNKKQGNTRGREQTALAEPFPKQKGQTQHKRGQSGLESDSEEYPEEEFEEDEPETNAFRKEEVKEVKAKPVARGTKGKKESPGSGVIKNGKGGSKPAESDQGSMRSSAYEESAPPLNSDIQKSVESGSGKGKNAKTGSVSTGAKSGGADSYPSSKLEERKASQMSNGKNTGERFLGTGQPQSNPSDSGYGSVRSSAQEDFSSSTNPEAGKASRTNQGKPHPGKSGNPLQGPIGREEVLQLEDDESEEEADYDEDFEADQPQMSGTKGEAGPGRKPGQGEKKKTDETRAIQLVGKKAKSRPRRSQSQEKLSENEEYAEDFEETEHASKQPEKHISQVESSSKLVSKLTEKGGKTKKSGPKTDKPANNRKPEKPSQKAASKEADDGLFLSQKPVLFRGKKQAAKQTSDQYPEDRKSSDDLEESVEEKETRISMIKEKLMKGGQIPDQEELSRLKEYRRAQLKRQKVNQVEKKPDKRGTEEEQLLADRQYQSLNEEVEDQRKVVKGLRLKFKSAMAEIQDLNHEHEVEKEDLLEGIRSKDRETGFLYQVLEKLLSSEQLSLIKQKSKFDDENNEWTVPPFLLQQNKQTVFPKIPRRQAQEMVDAEMKGKTLKFQEGEEEENGLRNARFQDWKKNEDRDRKRGESQPGSEADRPSSRGLPGGNMKAVLLDPLEKAPVVVLPDGSEPQLLNSPHSRKRLLMPIPYDSTRGMAVSDEFPKAGKRSYIS